MSNYIEFSEKELNKLNQLQTEFKNKYDINSYSNWFYDSESSLLRLYNDEQNEIFFKYIPIGTFSINDKTWMWSWFNESLIEKNKLETNKIKAFGIKNNYEKLAKGTFESDKYDGWDFLAISLSILGGIGTYKVSFDNLEKYMLLTEIVEDKNALEIKKLKQKKVDCGLHGFRRPAFVCQHLDLTTKNDFEEAFESYKEMELEEDDDFQAWCGECEKIRIKNNGWNEVSEEFAKIKLVCEDCYFDLKRFNQ